MYVKICIIFFANISRNEYRYLYRKKLFEILFSNLFSMIYPKIIEEDPFLNKYHKFLLIKYFNKNELWKKLIT